MASSLLTRQEWTLFFLFYYIACAVEYLDTTSNTFKTNMLSVLDTYTRTVLSEECP